MKYLRFLIVPCFLVVFGFNFIQTTKPETEITNRLKVTTTQLLRLIIDWNQHLDIDITEHHKRYVEVRQKYKSIESYVSFRYPELEKSINGGPVPSISTDVIILQKDEPHGLQVVEELLFADFAIDTLILQTELRFLQKNFEKLNHSWNQFPLITWEIFDAQHQLVSRIMSLGLTGFDSPGALMSIEDAIVNLETSRNDLHLFKNWGNPIYFDSIQLLFNSSINFLRKAENFAELNRVALYRNHLIPLQSFIRKWHFSTQYETYEETGALPRAIQTKGLHLFDQNYLNPFFTMRGAQTSPTQAQINLGKLLFFDPILSHSLTMSCASCHDPNMAYSDSKTTSISNNSNVQNRNSPGLINAAYQGNFFWDLKSEDMNNQIMHVFESPLEFNTTSEELIGKLNNSKAYVQYFTEAFPGYSKPVTMSHIKASLEAFVRSLNALNSNFDAYLRSESNHIDPAVIRGANIFMGKAACATCHFAPIWNGFVPPNYGESEGEIIGVFESPNSLILDSDLGRFTLYQKDYPAANYIKGMFKTPGIRNIQYTAPYMHNGQYKTLDEVMEFYNHGGALGKGVDWPQQTLASDSLNLTTQEIQDVIRFMHSLSDTAKTVVRPFPLPEFSNPKWNNRKWKGTYSIDY